MTIAQANINNLHIHNVKDFVIERDKIESENQAINGRECITIRINPVPGNEDMEITLYLTEDHEVSETLIRRTRWK